MFCTQCGKKIDKNGRFCSSCGHDMGEVLPKETDGMEESQNLDQTMMTGFEGGGEPSPPVNAETKKPVNIALIVLVVAAIIGGILLSEPRKIKKGNFNNIFNQQILFGDNGEVFAVHSDGKAVKVDVEASEDEYYSFDNYYTQTGNYAFVFGKEDSYDFGELVSFYGENPKVVSKKVENYINSPSGDWIYYTQETKSSTWSSLYRYNIKTDKNVLLSDTVKYSESDSQGNLAISGNGEYAAFIMYEVEAETGETTENVITVIVDSKGIISPFPIEDLRGRLVRPIAISDDGKNLIYSVTKGKNFSDDSTIYHRISGEDIPIGKVTSVDTYSVYANNDVTELVYTVDTNYGDDAYFYYKDGKSVKIADDLDYMFTPNSTLIMEEYDTKSMSIGLEDFSQVVFGSYDSELFHILDGEIINISSYDEEYSNNSDVEFAGGYFFYIDNYDLFRYNLKDGAKSGVMKDVYNYILDETGETVYFISYDSDNLYKLTSDGKKDVIDSDAFYAFFNNEKDTIYTLKESGVYVLYGDKEAIQLADEKEFDEMNTIVLGSGFVYINENGDTFFADKNTEPVKIASDITYVYSSNPKDWVSIAY